MLPSVRPGAGSPAPAEPHSKECAVVDGCVQGRASGCSRAMDMTTTRHDEITPTLPQGYHAREFRESDREPMVVERNAQVPEMQRGTADEWREWEQMDPPKDLFRTVVEGADGHVAATADIGPGHFPRPDGAQTGGVNVARADRGKGLGTALLGVIEAEAARRKAPRILSGTSVAFAGALEWAQKRGYRE